MPATKQTLINAFQPLLAEQLSETQEDMANALSDLKQKAVPEELLKPVRGAIASSRMLRMILLIRPLTRMKRSIRQR